jgi:hypothetical protein
MLHRFIHRPPPLLPKKENTAFIADPHTPRLAPSSTRPAGRSGRNRAGIIEGGTPLTKSTSSTLDIRLLQTATAPLRATAT